MKTTLLGMITALMLFGASANADTLTITHLHQYFDVASLDANVNYGTAIIEPFYPHRAQFGGLVSDMPAGAYNITTINVEGYYQNYFTVPYMCGGTYGDAIRCNTNLVVMSLLFPEPTRLAFWGYSLTIIPPAEVPLPAALPLFAIGLGMLGLLGWRNGRRRQGGSSGFQ